MNGRPTAGSGPGGCRAPTGRVERRRALVLLLAGLAADPAGARSDLSATLDDTLFGLHLHGVARGEPWPAFDFGHLRLWDSRTAWRDLEPAPGLWRFDTLDRYVAEAERRGVKVLLTLGQTPAWAAREPTADSAYGSGASSAPRRLEDWGHYVGTLARRYRGRVQAWEVWNEANVQHFYSGDYTTLAELERVAAAELHAVDPANVLLTPSFQGGAFGQLDKYLAAGGGRHADAVSYHFYAVQGEPEDLPARIQRVREVMANHGLGDKPLWNTEVGWLIPNADGGFGDSFKPNWRAWRKTGREEAAGFVLRTFLLSLDGGIRHVFWYAWDNRAMGLAEDRGRAPKPAAQGYARARQWLVGGVFKGCGRDPGESGKPPVWRCLIERDGRTDAIVWSQAPQRLHLGAEAAGLRVQGLLEAVERPAGPTLDIGPLPVRLRR